MLLIQSMFYLHSSYAFVVFRFFLLKSTHRKLEEEHSSQTNSDMDGMEYYIKEYYTEELLRICAQGCNVADMQVSSSVHSLSDALKFLVCHLLGPSSRHVCVFFTSLVQVCITNGANINVCDNLGSTPLYFATKGGHMDAVRYLVQCGVRCLFCFSRS